MKDLTHKEFHSAPREVQYIYINACLKQPILGETLDKAIKEHPEYFEEEIQAKKEPINSDLTKHWDAFWEAENKLMSDKTFSGLGLIERIRILSKES